MQYRSPFRDVSFVITLLFFFILLLLPHVFIMFYYLILPEFVWDNLKEMYHARHNSQRYRKLACQVTCKGGSASCMEIEHMTII